MGTCWVCQPAAWVDDEEILDHLRLMHPDMWEDGPQRWLDGALVVYDATLEPDDFTQQSDG